MSTPLIYRKFCLSCLDVGGTSCSRTSFVPTGTPPAQFRVAESRRLRGDITTNFTLRISRCLSSGGGLVTTPSGRVGLPELAEQAYSQPEDHLRTRCQGPFGFTQGITTSDQDGGKRDFSEPRHTYVVRSLASLPRPVLIRPSPLSVIECVSAERRYFKICRLCPAKTPHRIGPSSFSASPTCVVPISPCYERVRQSTRPVSWRS